MEDGTCNTKKEKEKYHIEEGATKQIVIQQSKKMENGKAQSKQRAHKESQVDYRPEEG